MDDERAIARYRRWYSKLLGFYPKRYRVRFAESMEQTFSDLCRERAQAGGRGFAAFILWLFAETFAGILRERATTLGRFAVTRNAIQILKIVKYSAIAVGCLMVAGIVTLMFLARGTGEDIAGIVAPALLITLLSVVAAVVAAVMQGTRERHGRETGNDPSAL
jgi:hypothetical protein